LNHFKLEGSQKELFHRPQGNSPPLVSSIIPLKEEIRMARQDIRYTPTDKQSTEMHIGGSSGDPGVNPLGPADAPSNPAGVVINANGGKPFNVTVGSTKIVTPA